ncbi:SGNH hydrolase-type esterase domain-containing protein [Biscogniauxia mediterranea]|nr:SGNH hydrolase-type esterase domain-containing protein [Biscogniauxia mediterranea]
MHAQEIFLAHSRKPGFVGFVVLGDSYSAGIGTGVDGQEDDCRHGLHAHPQLIASDLSKSQGGPNATFQFLSCTGPETEEVLSGGDGSQIDAFNASLPPDFALLSIGGNDLGFFGVMNACVFRFYNFYSGTCETALKN